ncbi:uncharacterized protein LOC115388384 [Salarias fasciatus]|uniref:uncharacterized protein LOC115388384 n=1 Tax=Salarias fasciatus TaxID=181472 RepID=UPI001176D61F|nr:uncharacterized protein LOC115388384 [Salarias fasciatus]
MELEEFSPLEPRLKYPLNLNCVSEDLDERPRQTAEPEVMAGRSEDSEEGTWDPECKGGSENEEQVDDGKFERRLSKISQQVLERKNKIEVMEVEEEGKPGDESEPGSEGYTDSENEAELRFKPAFIPKYEVKQPQTLLKSDTNGSDSLGSLLPPIKLLLRQISKPEGVAINMHSSDDGMRRSDCEESSVDEESEETVANEEIEEKGATKCPQATEREPEAVKVNLVPGPVNLVEQISNLTQCAERFPERQSLSEERMGKGSPLCEKLREKIVEQFKNNVPQRKIAKNLGIALSTVHNIIKRFRESGQITVRKGQGRKPILTGCDIQALRQHCMENKLDSVVEITAWAQKHFGKTLSVNTVRRCIHKC